ncbi:MAG: hypothetical protein KF749_09695 [Bacteroidetes bacterium]|nr:hypothetical protein [Bacteroidota bacterium]MCW5895020.1 hypothetical protein [Bacteroidota bacterium]
MTLNEVKELLPLYVSGSLSAEQEKDVQQALEAHPQLKEELLFWQGMKQATLADAAYAQQHPSAEQIVRFAGGTLPAGEEWLLVENHLRSCESCRDELSLIQESTQETRTVRKPASTLSLFSFLTGRKFLRPALAFSLLAVVIAVGIYLKSNESPPQQAGVQPQAKETASVVSPKAEQVRRMAIALPYAGTLRHPSATRNGVQVFVIEDDVVLADVTVPVEYSAIAEGYRVDITPPAGERIRIEKLFQPSNKEDGMRSLLVTLTREQLAREGSYVVRVREVLKEGITGIDAEEYRYEFVVRRAPPP